MAKCKLGLKRICPGFLKEFLILALSIALNVEKISNHQKLDSQQAWSNRPS